MSNEITQTTPSKFVWYELHTPDGAASAAFYSKVMGWTTQDMSSPGKPYHLVSAGGIQVGGILPKPAQAFTNGAKPGWMGYLGVNDVEDFTSRVQTAGGIVHRPVEDIPGIGRFSVVADPQGAIFVLFQPMGQQEAPRMPAPGAHGTFSWHDLGSADWKKEFDFYSSLFGWTKDTAMDMGQFGTYQIFAIGGIPSGGMMNLMDPQQKPGWFFYMNVDDLDTAIERVKQAGGSITHGPSPVPGGQHIAHCLDPQGAAFGVVGPVKPDTEDQCAN